MENFIIRVVWVALRNRIVYFVFNIKLTYFWPIFPFYTPWKHQKTVDFLMVSGGIKWEHWLEMD